MASQDGAKPLNQILLKFEGSKKEFYVLLISIIKEIMPFPCSCVPILFQLKFFIQNPFFSSCMIFTSQLTTTHISSPSATGIKFYTRLTQQSHSFSRVGCKIWYEITQALCSKSKTLFKKFFRKDYCNYYLYVDLHFISTFCIWFPLTRYYCWDIIILHKLHSKYMRKH